MLLFAKDKIQLFLDIFLERSGPEKACYGAFPKSWYAWIFFSIFTALCACWSRKEGGVKHVIHSLNLHNGARKALRWSSIFFRGASDHNRPNLFKNKTEKYVLYYFNTSIAPSIFPTILRIWINIENRSNGQLQLYMRYIKNSDEVLVYYFHFLFSMAFPIKFLKCVWSISPMECCMNTIYQNDNFRGKTIGCFFSNLFEVKKCGQRCDKRTRRIGYLKPDDFSKFHCVCPT